MTNLTDKQKELLEAVLLLFNEDLITFGEFKRLRAEIRDTK